MRVRRNALCPCGSGQKYKKCCLHDDERQQYLIEPDTRPNSTNKKHLSQHGISHNKSQALAMAEHILNTGDPELNAESAMLMLDMWRDFYLAEIPETDSFRIAVTTQNLNHFQTLELARALNIVEYLSVGNQLYEFWVKFSNSEIINP